MRNNTCLIRYIAVYIGLMLLINIPLSVSSLKEIQDDGIWYDSFSDDTGIDLDNSENIGLKSGSINLSKGENKVFFNFNDSVFDHMLWRNNMSIPPYRPGGDVIKKLFRLKKAISEELIGQSRWSSLKEKDDIVFSTNSVVIEPDILGNGSLFDYSFSPSHHFRFKTNVDEEQISDINFKWFYGPYDKNANLKNIKVYIWKNSNFLNGYWELMGEPVEYDSSINTSANGDFNYTVENNDYINSKGEIDILVIAVAEKIGSSSILTSDFVNITLTTTGGYIKTGHVVSEEIKKDSSDRWESVIWDSTANTKYSNIKIQVLDKNLDVISDNKLDGNKDGFSGSPLDLSDLEYEYDIIRLKANFESKDLENTPILYEWGVTYQVEENAFKDEFYSDLRIQEAVGISFENTGDDNYVKMSGFYDDWPMFGKNPANSRAYEGFNSNKASVYWKTHREIVGGGFRGPVLSDGLIYIADPVEDRVFAFNAKGKKSSDVNEVDSSKQGFTVDCSLGVSDNNVIVPTCKPMNVNKVYALDKNNLENQIWEYEIDESGNIGYSSSPTISENKVFITSWNSQPWYTPVFSFIYSFLQGNNYVICLGIDDGKEIWKQNLPAGSFSSPAVSDGKVYVGCDNIFNNKILGEGSLFCYDVDSGDKIWNASIGLVGRSSPVVYDNMVYVVAKDVKHVLMRGDVKLYALDKNTGEIIWNKTIAQNIRGFEKIPQGLIGGLKYLHFRSTSTPAVYNNALYVTSPDDKIYAFNCQNGEELWDKNLRAEGKLVSSNTCNSPVFVSEGENGRIYVNSPDGFIYSLKSSNGDTVWKYDASDPSEPFAPTIFYSSPIFAEGIVYASVTQEVNRFSGAVIAIGDYKANQKGRIISSSIHLPEEGSWSKFDAEIDIDDEENSSITFSILDEDYNVLVDDIQINDTEEMEKIKKGVIRLRADFNRVNDSQDPHLEFWRVNWTITDNDPPVFDTTSFKPSDQGWINTNTPVCSINVNDSDNGLDTDSAEFKARYILEDETGKKWSSYYQASCTGEQGSKKVETITCDISEVDNSENISSLLAIEIKISDISGSTTTFNFDEFNLDTGIPSSEIKNISEFKNIYNSPVEIDANTSETSVSGQDKSGIKHVGLYYKYSSDDTSYGSWKLFSNAETLYNWIFGKNIDSGYYMLTTRAVDNAGNQEKLPDEGEVKFLLDTNAPDKPALQTTYRFNDIPSFEIEFKDDYMLDDILYRMNYQSTDSWNTIINDVDSDTYEEQWSLKQSIWDELEEDKTYYIYFKITDTAGNIYETTSNSDAQKIMKDYEYSGKQLDLSDLQQLKLGNNYRIIGDFDEEQVETVELYYRYSDDNETWSEWKLIGGNMSSSPYIWDFNAEQGSGYYQFKTIVETTAGASDESPVETIKLTMFPMVQIILLIIAFIALVILSIIVVIRFRADKKII